MARELGCLCCGGDAEVRALCRACVRDVAPCAGLLQDHLRSTVAASQAAAWAVDGFGTAHALATRSTIGRSHDGELVILATSVSREHARLERQDAGWLVRDLGSRNGTFVDGVRVQGRAPVPARAVLKLGDVALWFLPGITSPHTVGHSFSTKSVAGGLVQFTMRHAGVELCLVGTSDATTGGALLTRDPGAETWTERGLAPVEFQMLRILCAKAVEEADTPAAMRGCVATKQLARDLPFQSKAPSEENVRQAVHRLRELLAENRLVDLLAAVPGRGYYLATAVTLGGAR